MHKRECQREEEEGELVVATSDNFVPDCFLLCCMLRHDTLQSPEVASSHIFVRYRWRVYVAVDVGTGVEMLLSCGLLVSVGIVWLVVSGRDTIKQPQYKE